MELVAGSFFELTTSDIGYLLLGLLIAGLAMFWDRWRSGSLADQWASENGYELMEKFTVASRFSPFQFTNPRAQTVYRITVRDATGAERKGWLRCGGKISGVLSSQVEVKWHDPNSNPPLHPQP